MTPRPLFSILLGLFLRVSWWLYARPVPASDFEYYRRFGLDLLVHHQLGYPRPSAMRVPGYPALLAALMLISRSIDWLALANVALSVLLIPVVYRLARRLTDDEWVARVAALLCALNPEFVFLSPVLASEHLFTLLLFGAMLPLLANSASAGPSRGQVVAAGAIFGAATLTRPDALFYLPVVALMARSGSPRLVPRYRPVLVLLLVVFVLVFPWYLRNRIEVGAGAGLSVQGGLTFYYGHNARGAGYHDLAGTPLEGLTDVKRQRKAYELGWNYIRDSSASRLAGDLATATTVLFWGNGGGSFHWSTRAAGHTPDDSTEKAIAGRATLESVEQIGYRALLVGALASVFFAWRNPRRLWVAYGVLVMTWIGYAWVYLGMTRYRYASEVAMCVLAAITLRGVRRLFVPGAEDRLA